jgi:hypothetical protein
MGTDGEGGTTSDLPAPERLVTDWASCEVTRLGGGHGQLPVMVREATLTQLGQAIDAGLAALVARWKHAAAPRAGRDARRMSFPADHRR